jgi:hypothetical protein
VNKFFSIMIAAISSAAAQAAPAAQPKQGLSAPATISQSADGIWRTLDRAAWVAERDPTVKPNGKVVYAVSFRSCPTCAAFKAAEHDALLKAGVELRWIMYARRDRDGKARSKPGERSMVAELWLNRDAELMNRWWAADDLDAFYRADDLPPSADGDVRREGAVARSRALVDTLSGIFEENAIDMAIPTLIWREGAQTKVSVGYSSDGFAPARAYLTAR